MNIKTTLTAALIATSSVVAISTAVPTTAYAEQTYSEGDFVKWHAHYRSGFNVGDLVSHNGRYWITHKAHGLHWYGPEASPQYFTEISKDLVVAPEVQYYDPDNFIEWRSRWWKGFAQGDLVKHTGRYWIVIKQHGWNQYGPEARPALFKEIDAEFVTKTPPALVVEEPEVTTLGTITVTADDGEFDNEWYEAVTVKVELSEGNNANPVDVANMVFNDRVTGSFWGGNGVDTFSGGINFNAPAGSNEGCISVENYDVVVTGGRECNSDGSTTTEETTTPTTPTTPEVTEDQVVVTVGDLNYVVDLTTQHTDAASGLKYYNAASTNTEFDGLTTVESSPQVQDGQRTFIGYIMLDGGAGRVGDYRNKHHAFVTKKFWSGPLAGRSIVVKLHDDDIMKNSQIAGFPANYTHLQFGFINSNLTYTRGDYTMGLTDVGLEFGHFDALNNTMDDFDVNKLEMLSLREEIRVANRRGIKVIFSIGGAAQHNWSEIAAEGNSGIVGPKTQALVDLLLDTQADGVDLDYEEHTQYGIDPEGTVNEYIGVAKAIKRAIEIANADTSVEGNKTERSMTTAGWSTGGDCSHNTIARGIPSSECAKWSTQITKAHISAILKEAMFQSSFEKMQEMITYARSLVVGEYFPSYWGGGAGLHRDIFHTMGEDMVREYFDHVSIMSYDASYHYFDPVVAYEQYRDMLPSDIPVVVGLQPQPEGWNDGQVLVGRDSQANATLYPGTVLERDQYQNEINASYSVERVVQGVVNYENANPLDGAMVWTAHNRANLGQTLHPEVAVGTRDLVAITAEVLEHGFVDDRQETVFNQGTTHETIQ